MFTLPRQLMELSKFTKHKEREVVTLLTPFLKGVRYLYSEVKIGEKVVALQRVFLRWCAERDSFSRHFPNEIPRDVAMGPYPSPNSPPRCWII